MKARRSGSVKERTSWKERDWERPRWWARGFITDGLFSEISIRLILKAFCKLEKGWDQPRGTKTFPCSDETCLSPSALVSFVAIIIWVVH